MDPRRVATNRLIPVRIARIRIQQRSQNMNQEFQWLGHAGQEGGDRNGQQHPANHWATLSAQPVLLPAPRPDQTS